MNQAQFQANLQEARGYLDAITKWLRNIGLEGVVVDKFETHVNTIITAASEKAPPPAKIIGIKDYLPKV